VASPASRSARPSTPAPAASSTGLRRLLAPTNLLTSIVLIFPLFLFYQFAVLFSPS
jgi:hypothetical protein